MLMLSENVPPIPTLMAMKLTWVRPHHREWASTLRNPTVGRMLEFFRYRDVHCVHVRSPAARKLFKSLS
jgi:hypothetical protein